jgi:hypothetical protein
MSRIRHTALALLILSAGGAATSLGQGRPDPAALTAAQRQAIGRLAYLDGVWRGTGWMILPTGEKTTFTQTERIGPFLDGSIRLLEGRGYGPDGSLMFNSFAAISFDPQAGSYKMRSYAMGHAGDFAFRPTADGFTWEILAGPTTIRYTADFKDGVWHEVGDRIPPGQEPVRFLEMTLKRVGDTDWPAAGAIGPQ